MTRFVGRCLVLLVCVYLCFAAPEQFRVLQGGRVFETVFTSARALAHLGRGYGAAADPG